MAREDNLKPFKKGHKMATGRPKGSPNRSTVAKKWLSAMTKGINPETGEEEKMTLEERMTLAQISKAITGKDTSAYNAIMNSAFGMAKETIDLHQIAEQPLFEDVQKDDSDTEDTEADQEE